ncbi:MAG: hypothetical protein L0241_03710, partial [Planctomycetia bacterium]|nr:hypothetical protein [Planctomycetia bacterium]
DSITAAVNRESGNMVQGIVVFSDGRSNLGSASSFAELRERASRERIPIFTVAVGEDRQSSSIYISSVLAPDSAPIDEAWKVNVEADGVNLANKEVDVFLDLFMPGKDLKDPTVRPDETLTGRIRFAPGDPPHGQAEFTIDPASLKAPLTKESTDAAIKKRVLVEGKWSVRARIPKHEDEAFTEDVHIRNRPNINVVQQKVRILLVSGAPSREFIFLRTMLAREVADKRATLTTLVQNEAGTSNKLTAEKDEVLIHKFPIKFDLKDIKDDPDKAYNLNEYDVLIAFDPDWSELSEKQAEDLSRWVTEGGGGVIYVAGPINTFQLARIEMGKSRLGPLLDILPVGPADIIAQQIKRTPKYPRRLYLHPNKIPTTELLKLDDKITVVTTGGTEYLGVPIEETAESITLQLESGDKQIIPVKEIARKRSDPVGGWERFFTDRDKYVLNMDQKAELSPRRGFFSCYPLLSGKEALDRNFREDGTKPGSEVIAEFADVNEVGELVRLPWIVINNPASAYRTAFLGSGELYKMRVYEPDSTPPTGQSYFERFWMKLIKYAAGKRNVKAPRGRVLVGTEAVSGEQLRVQARILDPTAKPYTRDIGAKFKILQVTPTGEKLAEFGPFNLTPKMPASGSFDGYYVGQEQLDPKTYPPGELTYRVVVEVPDSSGEELTGEFRIRKADPEMDNTRPDYPAMLKMASEYDQDFQARLTDKLKDELGSKLPKEAGVQRLSFKITDTESLKLIPECMMALKPSSRTNQGPINDLWDRGITLPVSSADPPPRWSGRQIPISWVMLVVISLLSLEWLARKLLRLA